MARYDGYDPYSRGDNPWRGDLDLPPRLPMPATAPRAAAAKKPKPKSTLPETAPLPPTRPPVDLTDMNFGVGDPGFVNVPPRMDFGIGSPGFAKVPPNMNYGMGDVGFPPPTRVADRQPGPQPQPQLTATGDNPILRFLAGLFSGTANAR